MTGYFNIFTVISLVLNVGSGDVIRPSPINIAVREGKEAKFECQANDGEFHSWLFAPVGSSTPKTFYHRNHGRMSNLTSLSYSTSPDGRVSIKTESVRMEDAGIYVCDIGQAEGNKRTVKQRSAQLIVLASEPKCWRDGSDGRWFRCSVDYRGNWAPAVEWRRDGPGGPEVTGGLQDVVTNNQSVTFSISFVGGNETSVSNASIVCRISFSFNGSSTGTAANNVPSYTLNATNCPDSDKSSTYSVSSTGVDTAPKREESKFLHIIIATGVVVCILFIILIFISTRNFKKYRSGSVRPKEIVPVVRNSVQSPKMERVSQSSDNLLKFKEADSLVSVRSSRTLSDRELQKLGREECIEADGTVYMKMGNVDDNMNSLSRSALRQSRHETIIYASIDHTVKPLAYPPPPLPTRY